MGGTLHDMRTVATANKITMLTHLLDLLLIKLA